MEQNKNNTDNLLNGITQGEWQLKGLTIGVHGRGTIATIPTVGNNGVMQLYENAKLIAAAPKLAKENTLLKEQLSQLEQRNNALVEALQNFITLFDDEGLSERFPSTYDPTKEALLNNQK